jgi:hypothetical protein
VAWVGGFLTAEKTHRQASATAVANLQTSLAALDRDYVIACVPQHQTHTNSYASAQTAYWTAEVNAANARRTAEANALAAYRSADYAASAEGVATIETAIDIPWTQYQTDLAAAKAAWSETSEEANFLGLTTATNAAESAYQTAVNTAFTTWATNTALAEKNFATAAANADYTWFAADFTADANYEIALAAADHAWQVAHVTARRNLEVDLATHHRTFADDGDAQARDSADAASETTRTTADRASDQAYTLAESTAWGASSIIRGDSRVTYTGSFNTAALAYVAATAGADRTYSIAESAAAAARAVAIAESLSDYDITQSDSFAAAIDSLSTSNGTPWALYDADLAEINAAFAASLGPALEELADDESAATLAYETSLANSLYDLAVALATAEATHRASTTTAHRDRILEESAAQTAAAQTIPINTLAPAALNWAGERQPSSASPAGPTRPVSTTKPLSSPSAVTQKDVPSPAPGAVNPDAKLPVEGDAEGRAVPIADIKTGIAVPWNSSRSVPDPSVVLTPTVLESSSGSRSSDPIVVVVNVTRSVEQPPQSQSTWVKHRYRVIRSVNASSRALRAV